MRILPPIWPAANLGTALEGLRSPIDSIRWEGPRVPGTFASSGGGGIGGASPDLNPSLTSVFSPESRVRLAGILQKVLDRLPARSTTTRLRGAPRVLIERGLSNGHFDPSFWLIDTWFGRKGRWSAPFVRSAPTLALAHFQKKPIRVTRASAALWIGLNILLQNHQIDSCRWPFLHSRRLEMFGSTPFPHAVNHANDFWRSDGTQGGIWFYSREAFRDESSHGRWLVIAAIPEPFVYQFTAMNRPGAVVLPGPIPPGRVVRQGPSAQVLREIEAEHGGVDAFLMSLETGRK